MALLPTPHRLTHPHSPPVCVLPLSSPFGTFSVYLSTGSPSALSSKPSLDMAFFFLFLKVQPVDVSVTPVQPRPWQVGFNNFFNRQQGGGFDHLPKMSRCSGGHVFILHPSPPMYVTNENYFLPLFQAKGKTDLTKHARRQHPPPHYVQVSFSLSHPSSASPIAPGHPPPTLQLSSHQGTRVGERTAAARAAAASAPPRVQHWTAPAPAQPRVLSWLTEEPTKQRARRIEAALQGFGCGQAASLNRLSSREQGEAGVWFVAKAKDSN